MNIHRRAFMVFAAAALLSAPMAAISEAKTLNFTKQNFQKHLKSGKPFMLGVHTDWCSTCATQKRVIGSLKSSGAPYSGLTVLEMDWDKYRGSKLGKQLRIPRRSTLIMFNAKGKETGRIIAGTSSSQIKKLIDEGI